jgi:LacI family transcriptional regulator
VEEGPLLAWLARERPDAMIFAHIFDTLPALRETLRRNRARVPAGLGVAVLSQIVEGSGFSGLQQNQPLMGAWAVELLAARIANRDFGIPASPRVELVESRWVEGGSLVRRAGSTVERSGGGGKRDARTV